MGSDPGEELCFSAPPTNNKEELVEDEFHLLFTCSSYSAIRESYVDILRGGDELSVTLNRTPHMCMPCLHIKISCLRV